MDTLRLITEARIIPTIKLASANDAPALFAALCSGGMNAALVSMQTDAACDILRLGSRLFPDLLLGAEGVRSAVDAKAALQSGARILASYGFSPEIAAVCNESGAFYLPFCLSPSELLAHEMQGGKAAGIFSPEAFGAISAVQALSAAYPSLPLAAGNIPLDRLSDYLAEGNIVAVTCPELAKGTLDEVIAKCQSAARLIHD